MGILISERILGGKLMNEQSTHLYPLYKTNSKSYPQPNFKQHKKQLGLSGFVMASLIIISGCVLHISSTFSLRTTFVDVPPILTSSLDNSISYPSELIELALNKSETIDFVEIGRASCRARVYVLV